MKKQISILGSTGSIGTNTLDVIRQNPDRFEVHGLVCGKNLSLLKEQILEFRPKKVSVASPEDAQELREGLHHYPVELFSGAEGAIHIATDPAIELVVSAMVGGVGLLPTFRAIEAGKTIALANKETLVMAGELMTKTAKKKAVKLLPVDSEHNAIFQSLVGHQPSEVRRLILTASGGPFRTKSYTELQNVTLEEALQHPNWKMGPKITIDSATMMNKGLELIEAYWLFDVPVDRIDVCVHPESIIHSMVEYHDGSVIAQLGIPDMRVPISYALSYPSRFENRLPSLDLFKIQQLHFYPPDLEKFSCLKLAKEAIRRGGDTPCVLNAANEVAVDLFLKGEIAFLDIPKLVSQTLQSHSTGPADSLEHLLSLDQQIRKTVRRWKEIQEPLGLVSGL